MTARVDGHSVALVFGVDGLLQLDLDTLEYESLFVFDTEREVARNASYGADRWVVVMSEAGIGRHESAGRRIVFLDADGSVISRDHNPFPESTDQAGPWAAALSSDGATLVFSIEEEDGSSSLVLWDMDRGVETARFRITEPVLPGDAPYGYGQEFVTSIDISGSRILVNLWAVGDELHPSGALVVDFDGNVSGLGAPDELEVSAAAFLEG